MAAFVVKRVLIVIPLLLAVLTVTFFASHILPGDPAVRIAGSEATPENIAAIRAQLGLDRPLVAQYGSYLSDAVRGDFGTSMVTNRPIIDELLERLPSTLLLTTLALLISTALGVGLAVLTAGRRGVRDVAGRAWGTFGTATPDFFLGLLLIYLFYAVLHWAPAPIGQAGALAPVVPTVTRAYLIDAILAGNVEAIRVGLQHLVLPLLTLIVVCSAPIYRVARAAFEEIQRSAYVDYATAMGAAPKSVRRMTILNSLPPVLTISGIIYGVALGGAVLVETIFGWGGIGQYAVDSVAQIDYPAIQGFVLVAAVFSTLVYLVVDLTHGAFDPRVRRAR